MLPLTVVADDVSRAYGAASDACDYHDDYLDMMNYDDDGDDDDDPDDRARAGDDGGGDEDAGGDDGADDDDDDDYDHDAKDD